MEELTNETICVLTAMVLFTTAVVSVGHDVRQMKIRMEEIKAESCYRSFKVNSGNGTVYVAEDYCAEVEK